MSATRRGLLAASATVGIMPTVSAQAHPDAVLKRLCEEFSDLERRWSAAFDDPAISGDAERDLLQSPLKDRQEDLLEQIVAMEATTLAGLLARLEMIQVYKPQFLNDPHGWDEEMAQAIVRDAMTILRGGRIT